MKKLALIISAGAYQDEYFTTLQKTTADAEGLAKVLRAKEHGAFDKVETFIDKGFSEVSAAVLRFYKQSAKDDLLLLYFCGHGVRHADGGLYLALVDTEHDILEASALNCAALRKCMEKSRCKRQLLILDCCASGAFESSKQATSGLLDLQEQLAPTPGNLFDPSKQEGRFVLTATKKTELAFERYEGTTASPNSPYAQALIEGFSQAGAQNAQGHLTVNSLHHYVYHQVTASSQGDQHPQIMGLLNDGDLLLVKSKHKLLPNDLLALLQHKDPEQREFGVIKLGRLRHGDGAYSQSASEDLQGLCNDRDSLVKNEAIKLRFRKLLDEKPNQETLQVARAELQGFLKESPKNIEVQQLLVRVDKQLEALALWAGVQRGAKPGPAKVQKHGSKKAPKFNLRKKLGWVGALASGVPAFLVGAWQVYPNMPKPKEQSSDEALAGVTVLNPSALSPSFAPTTEPTPAPTARPKPTQAPTPKPKTTKIPRPTAKPKGQAQYKGGQIIQDKMKSGGLSPKMVVIPAGEFLMGSPPDELKRDKDEGPQHRVSLQTFAMGQTEVTFEDYDRFAKATQRDLPDGEGWGRGKQPVINVSWQDAQAYVRWLNQQTGERYRLPSEAEWEYAARAGTSGPFSTGHCISGRQANFYDQKEFAYSECPSTEVYQKRAVAVASYPANAFGLYDMHGNVWEWVEDCYHASYEGAPNDGNAWGQVGEKCATRVVRGGSWGISSLWLRSALRGWDDPDVRYFYFGFRLARTLFNKKP